MAGREVLVHFENGRHRGVRGGGVEAIEARPKFRFEGDVGVAIAIGGGDAMLAGGGGGQCAGN